MNRFVVIAHRGASAVAPEGTGAAIRAAIRARADMVEFDVQLTKDTRLVVFHDDRLERTTSGRGRLRERTYAELDRLDAGAWFHPHFTGERILLLSRAIRLLPPPMRMNVELKRTSRPRLLLTRVRACVKRLGVGSRILLSSFEPALLEHPRADRIARALICRRQPDTSLRRAIRLGCAAWHPFHTLVTARRVAQAHAHGLRVHAWTVDDVARARRLAQQGVDGIFTNDPARLRRAFRKQGR